MLHYQCECTFNYNTDILKQIFIYFKYYCILIDNFCDCITQHAEEINISSILN